MPDRFQVDEGEGDPLEPGLVREDDGSITHVDVEGNRTSLVNADGTLAGAGGTPDGAVWVYPFASAAETDDAIGENGDLAVLLDSLTILQKEGGTWQS